MDAQARNTHVVYSHDMNGHVLQAHIMHAHVMHAHAMHCMLYVRINSDMPTIAIGLKPVFATTPEGP